MSEPTRSASGVTGTCRLVAGSSSAAVVRPPGQRAGRRRSCGRRFRFRGRSSRRTVRGGLPRPCSAGTGVRPYGPESLPGSGRRLAGFTRSPSDRDGGAWACRSLDARRAETGCGCWRSARLRTASPQQSTRPPWRTFRCGRCCRPIAAGRFPCDRRISCRRGVRAEPSDPFFRPTERALFRSFAACASRERGLCQERSGRGRHDRNGFAGFPGLLGKRRSPRGKARASSCVRLERASGPGDEEGLGVDVGVGL